MRNIDLPSMDRRWPLQPASRRTPPTLCQRLEDRQFIEMEQAFRTTGGLIAGNELAWRLRRHSDQPISVLARWIVERRVVSVPWQSQTLLPMFQFEVSNLKLRAAVTTAVDELKDVFDDWELALWFARPNSWLFERAPADVVAVDATAVFEAARADRFIAQG